MRSDAATDSLVQVGSLGTISVISVRSEKMEGHWDHRVEGELQCGAKSLDTVILESTSATSDTQCFTELMKEMDT